MSNLSVGWEDYQRILDEQRPKLTWKLKLILGLVVVDFVAYPAALAIILAATEAATFFLAIFSSAELIIIRGSFAVLATNGGPGTSAQVSIAVYTFVGAVVEALALRFQQFIVANYNGLMPFLSADKGGGGNTPSPKNIRVLSKAEIKEYVGDAHAFKDEIISAYELKDKVGSHYDLYLNKDTGEIWMFLKAAQGNGWPTGEYLW